MPFPRCPHPGCGGQLFRELGRLYCHFCGREPVGPVPLPSDGVPTEYTADYDALWQRAQRVVLAEEAPCSELPPLSEVIAQWHQQRRGRLGRPRKGDAA